MISGKTFPVHCISVTLEQPWWTLFIPKQSRWTESTPDLSLWICSIIICSMGGHHMTDALETVQHMTTFRVMTYQSPVVVPLYEPFSTALQRSWWREDQQGTWGQRSDTDFCLATSTYIRLFHKWTREKSCQTGKSYNKHCLITEHLWFVRCTN